MNDIFVTTRIRSSNVGGQQSILNRYINVSDGQLVNQLYMSVHLGPVTVYGGKIHPRFGFAWDIAPGLYGTDFAEDYELVEQLGVGAVWRLPVDYGRHDLSAEWFRSDTSVLTRSLFTRTLPEESKVPSRIEPSGS